MATSALQFSPPRIQYAVGASQALQFDFTDALASFDSTEATSPTASLVEVNSRDAIVLGTSPSVVDNTTVTLILNGSVMESGRSYRLTISVTSSPGNNVIPLYLLIDCVD